MRVEVAAESLLERRRSLTWWALGILGVVALTLAFYPSIQDQTALNDYSRSLPESLRALFVGGEVDLVSGAGYLNSQIFSMLAPLLLLILSIGFGASAIAGEEERGMLDLLLAQPLSRRRLVWERFLALGVALTAVASVLTAAVLVGDPLVGLDVPPANVIAAGVSALLLALLYGAIALAVGAAMPGRGRAVGIAAALATGAWILDGFGRAVEGLEPWRPLSPFYQALGQNPLRDGAPWDNWLLLLALALLCGAAAAIGLERRDVRPGGS